MGCNPWKTKHQLYLEKTANANYSPMNAAMQRGLDLEPTARFQFTLMTGVHTEPAVFVKDWQMASVDGISEDGTALIEIKCPGEKDHSLARFGKIPQHYYPQVQHQLEVCGLDKMYYFSFDGQEGLIVEVFRDQEFIDRMNASEWEFYQRLINKNPPEEEKPDFEIRNDEHWQDCAARYVRCKRAIFDLEKELDYLKEQLVYMAADCNSKGCGVTVSKITIKGKVNFACIPELEKVDLEKYREPSRDQWRVLID